MILVVRENILGTQTIEVTSASSQLGKDDVTGDWMPIIEEDCLSRRGAFGRHVVPVYYCDIRISPTPWPVPSSAPARTIAPARGVRPRPAGWWRPRYRWRCGC